MPLSPQSQTELNGAVVNFFGKAISKALIDVFGDFADQFRTLVHFGHCFR